MHPIMSGSRQYPKSDGYLKFMFFQYCLFTRIASMILWKKFFFWKNRNVKGSVGLTETNLLIFIEQEDDGLFFLTIKWLKTIHVN